MSTFISNIIWRQFIYESFTSNNCQNFDDIYSDFENMPKLDFCAKWDRYLVFDTPIEQWYEKCMSYYTEHKQAEEFLKNLKVCSCP